MADDTSSVFGGGDREKERNSEREKESVETGPPPAWQPLPATYIDRSIYIAMNRIPTGPRRRRLGLQHVREPD